MFGKGVRGRPAEPPRRLAAPRRAAANGPFLRSLAAKGQRKVLLLLEEGRESVEVVLGGQGVRGAPREPAPRRRVAARCPLDGGLDVVRRARGAARAVRGRGGIR